MTKHKTTPMTPNAAARVRSGEAKQHGGKIPPAGFGTRADRVLQQREAAKKS